jgi:hypothetical protein
VADDDRGGWHRNPQPASADPVRALWPWVFPTGSRPVPVVGPTEALRDRAGGAVTAPPPRAVPGPLDPAQRSSWQLAQEVWQESGVTWEPTTPGLADADPAYLEPSDPEPAVGDAWLGGLEPDDDGELGASDPAGFDPAVGDAWLGGPEPDDDSELGASHPADFEPAAGDAWLDGAEPDDRERRSLEPDGFEPAAGDAWLDGFGPAAADARPADPGLEDAAPADTWFTGVGPADQRFADARPADVEPVGKPSATGGVGPYFADSGVAPARPELPSRDYPRQAGRPQRPSPAWSEYPPDGFPGQAWPAGSGRVPLGAPVVLDPQAPAPADLTEPFIMAGPDSAAAPGWAGGASFSEPDELFRAWQGSVDEATARRGPWSVPRRAASATRRRRALQAAAIGVPVAVIVTVGAGALMILTGKANEMLAVRADTGAASPAASASGSRVGARPTAAGAPPAFVGAALSGYPGQRGTVTVASMLAAAGMTLAVGTADGHPAIWLRGSNGSWTLESAASLSAVAGSAGLTSVTHGPAGWIAVGATSDGRSTGPVVLASADGVRWQPVTSLAAAAGAGTEFLGAAAGRAGYVVVGRQMVGSRTFAVLWYSADLRSWTADSNDGLDGRLEASTANAVAATADGFVAVGSHGAVQSMWISADGRHWAMDSVPTPAGAASATLRSVAASGTRVVAGGYAATPAGDIPVAVASTDDGGEWRQIVLQAPDGLGVVTALTGTPDGFTAAGVVGRSGSQQTVTWTSPDGLAWSRPAQVADGEITALALTGTTVAGTAEQGATPTLVPLQAP